MHYLKDAELIFITVFDIYNQGKINLSRGIMYLAALLLFSFTCVTHLYAWISIQHMRRSLLISSFF